ncbi:MAG: hypothetical protein K1X94_15220 [Sandaracinaceae bacterium]|nr:hypothetical protein [Sandaracinaceae bacterium]
MRTLSGLVVLAFSLWLAAPALAQTSVPAGELAGDQIWTAAGSPYVLAGSITISDGASLRVEEGVEIQVPPTRTIGATGGLLTMVGTDASPIAIRSTVAGSRWQGIVATTGLVDLTHVDLVEVVVALDTQNGGSLSFVSVPVGAPVNVRAGNLSIRDSELGAADFSGTGTTSTFRSIFRGAVFFRGARAYVDHATIVGDVTGTGGADLFDSIVVQPRDLDCACVLDRVLVHPRSRGATNVAVDEIRNPLEPEDALLGAELRPTSRSPARFRDSGGGDLGARPYAGEPTARLEGWLWEDVHMTRASAEDIAGDLTVPAGHALVVDPGVRFAFPFGADELGYELRVAGSLVWGDRSGPPVHVDGTVTRGGLFPIVVESGGTLALHRVELARSTIEVREGASATIDDATLTRADPAVNVAHGATFAFARLRSSGGLVLDGTGLLENALVTSSSTALSLGPSAGDAVEVRHATVRCSGPSATGVLADASGTGTSAITYSVVTGCARGLDVIAPGFSITTSIVGANTVDAMGIALAPSVVTTDPQLDPATSRPLASSPCVDAATGSSTTLDLDEVARPVEGDGMGSAVSDLGAFEIGRGVCGDGAIDPGERCDDGAVAGYGWSACASDCRGHGPYCGDGVVTASDEDCDGTPGCTGACTLAPMDAGTMTDAAFEDAGASTDAASLDGAALDDASLDASGLDASGLDASRLDRDVGGRVDAGLADDGGLFDAAGTVADAGVPAPQGGCACRAAHAWRARGGWPVALAALGLLALARRRARRR